MASRSDSGNETRGSSESDNSSPTPTKELQTRTKFTPIKATPISSASTTTRVTVPSSTVTITYNANGSPNAKTQISSSAAASTRPQINTKTTPISRTTPLARPQPHSVNKSNHRLTPTTTSQSQRIPVRPLQRRQPSSGIGNANPGGQLGTLASSRGRQRNSVAVVDSREHIYEEFEMCRAPPKLAPVSGVLQQGTFVIRPIAFKPVAPSHNNSGNPTKEGTPITRGPLPSNQNGCRSIIGPNSGPIVTNCYPPIPSRPDPSFTSTPTLGRGPIQHYGSMGDLKSLSHSSGHSLDRRGLVTCMPGRNYHDPYLENNNAKYNSLTRLHNAKNVALNAKMNHSTSSSNKPISSPESVTNTSPRSNNSSSNCSGRSTNSTTNSPPSLPPPRPPSHQSTCSNVEDCQLSHTSHHRLAHQDTRLSSTYDSAPPYDTSFKSASSFSSSRSNSGYEGNPLKFHHSSNSSGADLPRYESMRNLSSASDNHRYSSSGHLHSNGSGLSRLGGSVFNLSRLTYHSGSVQGLDRSASMTGSNIGLDRSVSGSNFGLERPPCTSVSGSLIELRLNDSHQTPSPSDSGVAELEAMLKEKDSEINTLRETMEQNEQVIFKVYEEKEKTWERELRKIRDLYESRLRSAQQKALKVEQSLTTQTYQLQQERRKLTAELEEVKRERESNSKQVEQLRKELTSLRSTLEETEWGLCQKSGEISLLKTQLKDSQGDQTTRGHELLHLRAQVRQYQQEVERRRAEISSLHDLTTQLRRENTDLRTQLDHSQQTYSQEVDQEKARMETDNMRREIQSYKNQFEEERKRWIEEKERVIRYQKQLHHNYMSMFSRNRQLEEEVAKLTGVPFESSSTARDAAPSLPLTYSELREGSAIKSESRC